MTEDETKEIRGQQVRDGLFLLSEEDLSLALGVTVETLQTWRSKGTGPAFTKLGKTVFYRPSDVSDWADANVQPTHEKETT